MEEFFTSKRFIIFVIIFSICVVDIIFIFIGIVNNLNLQEILAGVLMSINIAVIVTGFIGWAVVKYFYPQLIALLKKRSITYCFDSINDYEYKLNKHDINALYKYIYNNSIRGKILKKIIITTFFLETCAMIILLTALGNKVLLISIILGFIAIMTAIVFYFLPYYKLDIFSSGLEGKRFSSNNLASKHHISLLSEGILDKQEDQNNILQWGSIKRVDYSEEYLFLTLLDTDIYIIPRKAFFNTASFKEFIEKIKLMVNQK
jgi:hypothetical protein